MTPPKMRPALAVTAIASLLFATIALPAPVAAEEPEPPADPGVVAAEQAAEEGQAVEVDEWTDEHSITHANPDGTFTLETGYEAARVKREGEWIPVDTAIEAAPDGRLRPAAAALAMDFSAGNDSHLATVTVDEHSLALHVPFTLTTPVITDDVITYPEVLPGVDLVVSVKPEEFSEVLVVKTPEAAANPVLQSFDLRIETTNVDFTVNADGSSQATAADGETVFQSPPPYMWDSTTAETGDVPSATNVGENATPIALEAAPQPRARITSTSATSTSTTVTLAPDAAALSGEDVQYPVYIDPLISVPKKVYVVARQGLPSYAENGDDLRVGYCTWTGCSPHYRARSYIAFDVWELMKKPDGTIPAVVNAKVTLKQTHAASSYDTAVRLARTTGPVDGTILWPGPLGSALVTKNTKAGDTVVNFTGADLTAYVNNLVYHQNGRLGFTLHAVNESDPYSWKKFRNDPELTLTYGFPPKTPTGLSIRSTTTICNGTTFVPTTTVTFGAHAVN